MTIYRKYETMANWLRERIVSGELRPGAKISSENELCRQFNVSRQTVRQALSVLEQEGLLVPRRGSGTYVTAQIPLFGRDTGKNIGVMMTYFDSYIFPEIINGIEGILSRQGYGMLLAATHNQPVNEGRILNNLFNSNIAGLLAEPTKSSLPSIHLDAYSRLSDAGVPVIFMNAVYPALDMPCVSLDDKKAGFIATTHLLNNGHKKIAGIFKSDDRQGLLRYQGYLEALRERGIESNSSNVLWYTTEDQQYMNKDFGRVMRCVTGCTGLVCYNDSIAYPLCSELIRRGMHVPEDLSVVGIDDAEPSGGDVPSLSTIAHPARELGAKAASMLLELRGSHTHMDSYAFEPILIERSSVKIIK